MVLVRIRVDILAEIAHLDLPNRHACAWYRCNKCEKCSPEAWGSTDEETEKAAYEAAVEWLQKEGAEDE